MVPGARLHVLSAPRGVLILLFVHGVGTLASGMYHRRVGATVHFHPVFQSSESFSLVEWRYNSTKFIELQNPNNKWALPTYERSLFKGRLELNISVFSLTVKNLELTDSGIFSVVIDTINKGQLPTQSFSLQVHEPITKPSIKANSTWQPQNQSCVVWVECLSPGHTGVSHTWEIDNQIYSEPRVRFHLQPSGRATVNCTASNPVSNASASDTVTCTNGTAPVPTNKESVWYGFYIVGALGGALLLGLITAVVLCYCRYSNSVNTDLGPDTVYADITSDNVELKDRRASTSNPPNSIYETISEVLTQPVINAQTVYDKIQFDRLPTSASASVSPYQHVL